ncbi:recombinase family protein [Maledivibacter halophilus]|uniref:Site-specific DNA recombinase n=1 Tax=Maledivibacter halophilus TaxID=36842 RepID=A0A1T5MGG1_9FIRM|nr:recombinase family protein [Maledivibacter halophilus]SKC87024.1 site-specific DNA recombinase [Maledivibacter halophilus]
MPTAAIYARKSKATDKGESLENQINRGKALCELREWDHVVYEDYDVSGKTLERPGFERMMKDIHNGKINYVVCYKLDRISRSVNDFSNLIEELNSIDIGFICIKDNFDTSTPMGRAMMYITSVFAQLERETIAERVKDNMIDRAKMGKWNGGPVPYGFDLLKETIENNGRNKKISKLVINNDEAAKIKEFYKWYLESDGSIRSNTTRANEKGYKTKNRTDWSHNQMSRILKNPLYCIADPEVYTYFKNNTDVQIINDKEDFNGTTNGLMYYNRRKSHKKTTRKRNKDEWILAIGEHHGIISGEIFKSVQEKLNFNKSRAPREGKSYISPLSGLVKCDRCDASMSVFGSNKSKKRYRYFRCITKEQKAKVLCDNSNVRADILEDLIVNHIIGLCDNKKLIQELIENGNNEIENNKLPLVAKRNKFYNKLDSIENEINNLASALGKGTLPELIIKKRYKELEKNKQDIKTRLNNIEYELNSSYEYSYDLESIIQYIKDFKNSYRYLHFNEKKKLLKSIVKEIRINRNIVKLELYFLPSQKYDSSSFCLRKDMDSY